MTGAAESLRVAVVGCGYQGRLHLECLASFEDVEIAAVCDTDAARAEEAARPFGATAYTSVEELLASEPIDLLTICTMPDTHRDIAVAAFEARAHVLCEKPFARNRGEAREMIEAAERADRLLAIGFNLRYTAAAQSVRRFVQTDEFGRPVCARGWMLSEAIPWWGRHYERSVSGGGALAATAVHMIDLLIWLAGDPTPVTATASVAQVFPSKRGASAPTPEAFAAYDTEDIVFGHIRFANGFWISIEGAWVWDNPGSGWDYSFDLVGARGQARLAPLRLISERNGELVDCTGASPAEFDFVRSTRDELADVVDAIRRGRKPLVRPEQAFVVQAVVDALYRSAELGHEVEIGDVAASRSG